MNIIMKSREDLNKEDLYFLVATECFKMQDVKDQTIEVKDWVVCEDTDKGTGEIKTILFVRSNDMTYATVSPTFIESFKTIVNCFGTDFSKISIKSGRSNKGREFLTCEYVRA